MVKMGRLVRQLLIRISLPPEEEFFPFHGGTLLAIFSCNSQKAALPNLQSLIFIPRYLIGRDPSWQFSILAILIFSTSSTPKM
jgi:hypothetical protein